MKPLRKTVTLMTLVAIGALAVLAVVGAFLGTEDARALFNSPPLAAFWAALLALLAVCFFVDWRLIRSPGLAAMHLGAMLILGGAMWGSEPGHALAARLLGRERIPHGCMVIHEGTRTSLVRHSRTGEVAGRLPFEVGLKDFRIEYYPSDAPWELGLEVPPGEDTPADRVLVQRFGWKLGEEVAVEGRRLRVRVVQYLPGARAVTDERGAVLRAEPDAASDLPAIEVELRLGDRTDRGWIVAREGEDYAAMALRGLLGIPDDVPEHAVPHLYLIRPAGMPKDYFSDLVIFEGGRPVAEKTIEVNDPLYWRGYHLYQMDYDKEMGAYTFLTVRSDAGLYAVYAGFALLAVGALVRCWAERTWSALRRGRSEASGGGP